MTIMAENQTRRFKRNRQMSYETNKLHQLDQKSTLISHLIYLLLGRDVEP